MKRVEPKHDFPLRAWVGNPECRTGVNGLTAKQEKGSYVSDESMCALGMMSQRTTISFKEGTMDEIALICSAIPPGGSQVGVQVSWPRNSDHKHFSCAIPV